MYLTVCDQEIFVAKNFDDWSETMKIFLIKILFPQNFYLKCMGRLLVFRLNGSPKVLEVKYGIPI